MTNNANASRIFVHGTGAVSPAGWGVPALFEAIEQHQNIPLKELKRPGWTEPLLARRVPPPSPRPAFLAHPRMRRASAITQFAVSASLEALGEQADLVSAGSLRLGIVFCVMSGCVNYSSRFYGEVLRDPASASPLIFPETVFNAPSSHVASLLGTTELNYTLVGDPGTFVRGLALAAEWLTKEQVDGCLIIGAEEIDWLTVDAYQLLARQVVLAEGAGALYLSALEPTGPTVELKAITDPQLFFCAKTRLQAAARVRAQLSGSTADLLCDGLQGIRKLDTAESAAWADWREARYSPKKILGEGLMAGAAWQCVAAAEGLRRGTHAAANISVVGCNEQAIGAELTRTEKKPDPSIRG